MIANRPRIVKYPWHIGHDYELFKLPFEWSLITDTSRSWASKHRPLPEHVSMIPSQAADEHDLMILHVDQWILDEVEKLCLFEYWCDRFPGPKIVLNHGNPMVDGCTPAEMQQLLGDLPVVCNSPASDQLWELANSRVILHGFSPNEWPETSYERSDAIVVQAYQGRHVEFRNNAGVEEAEAADVEINWVGRDCKFSRFEDYRAFLAKNSIFFNPSYASPNPRTRAEAMLCGLATVSTNCNGESGYIENGVNGFCSNDMSELIGWLKELQADPDLAQRIGRAGRETAQDVFHIDKFRTEWVALVDEVLRAA
ncbi:MAG: glycosyltransferase involved in cell wall biosynthesis [Verrucomicrobiales bacterium]|jgi:glycosyltransferase involved in cell wall biosynthesis